MFDTSNQATPFGDGGPDERDGGADAIAPQDCPEDIHMEIQVNGIGNAPPAAQPYARVILGDSVSLSATGSCTKTGTIDYLWTIEPGTTLVGATATPDLRSESISVYPLQPEQYTVRLTIFDGSQTQSRTIFAFAAAGFDKLPFVPGIDTKDLSAGSDYLWIGAKDGAFRADLSAPTAGPYPAVNDLYEGDDIPVDVTAVHESAAGTRVWFGTNAADGTVHRLDLANEDLSEIDTLDGAKSKDISEAASGGVRVATDKGVALSTDNSSFALERSDPADAVAFGLTGSWAGKDKLYPLPQLPDIDVFGGNNKLKALADDGTRLWIGGDDKGIATLIGGAVAELYTAANSKLSSDKPRAIVVDSGGDIWVASALGVNRFKKDRQVWVPMTGSAGFGATLDLKAISLDESSGRRAVYAGGKDGLWVMSPSP